MSLREEVKKKVEEYGSECWRQGNTHVPLNLKMLDQATDAIMRAVSQEASKCGLSISHDIECPIVADIKSKLEKG